MSDRSDIMNRVSSKLLSFVTAFSIAVPICTAMTDTSACAYGENQKCGAELEWSYDSSTYTLTITGKGSMYDFSATTDIFQRELTTAPWSGCKLASNLVIGEGVTSIGEWAFISFEYLKNVSLPSTLTEIGDYAFIRSCRLENINLPYGLKKIGNSAFMNTAITELTVPETVNEIGYLSFGYIPGLWSEEAPHKYPNFTVYGKKGSYAEQYANSPRTVIAVEPLDFVEISEKPKPFDIGDANKDGIIDGRDASLILSYYAYTSTNGKLSLDEYSMLRQ